MRYLTGPQCLPGLCQGLAGAGGTFSLDTVSRRQHEREAHPSEQHAGILLSKPAILRDEDMYIVWKDQLRLVLAGCRLACPCLTRRQSDVHAEPA